MTSAEIDLGAFTLSIRRAYITGASERCCPCVLFSTPSASKSTPTSEPPRYLRRFRASAAKYDTSLVSTVKRVYFGPAPEPERRGGRLVTAGRADHDRRGRRGRRGCAPPACLAVAHCCCRHQQHRCFRCRCHRHDRRCHRLRRLLQGTARPCESPPRTCERGRRAPRTPQSTRAACSPAADARHGAQLKAVDTSGNRATVPRSRSCERRD